jgi:hypothetical protein
LRHQFTVHMAVLAIQVKYSLCGFSDLFFRHGVIPSWYDTILETT